MKQLETDITLHIGKHEAELALRVNSSAYYGDLYQLKSLIRAGADPNKKDYDGRTPLVCTSSNTSFSIIYMTQNLLCRFGNFDSFAPEWVKIYSFKMKNAAC